MRNKRRIALLVIGSICYFMVCSPRLYQAAEALIDNNLEIKTDRLEKGQGESKNNTSKNNETLFISENQTKLREAKKQAREVEEATKKVLFTKPAVRVEAYDSKTLFKTKKVVVASQSMIDQEKSSVIGDFFPLVSTVALVLVGIWISTIVYKKGELEDGE